MKGMYRVRLQMTMQHYRKEWEKISLVQLWKDSIRDEYRKNLNKVWTEQVEKEVNTGLEMQWQQIKTCKTHQLISWDMWKEE